MTASGPSRPVPTREHRGVERGWRREVLEANTPPEAIPDLYTAEVGRHRLWSRLFESHPRRRLLELAAVRDGERVLELGCGAGEQLLSLARRNPAGQTVGVDIAPGVLTRPRARLVRSGLPEVPPALRRRTQPSPRGPELRRRRRSYLLDLLPRADIATVAGELHRVLRPGGRVVLAGMTRGQRPWHRFWDALYARDLSLTASCRGVLAEPVLREADFTDTQREYVPQLLLPSEVVRGQKPGR